MKTKNDLSKMEGCPPGVYGHEVLVEMSKEDSIEACRFALDYIGPSTQLHDLVAVALVMREQGSGVLLLQKTISPRTAPTFGVFMLEVDGALMAPGGANDWEQAIKQAAENLHLDQGQYSMPSWKAVEIPLDDAIARLGQVDREHSHHLARELGSLIERRCLQAKTRSAPGPGSRSRF